MLYRISTQNRASPVFAAGDPDLCIYPGLPGQNNRMDLQQNREYLIPAETMMIYFAEMAKYSL